MKKLQLIDEPMMRVAVGALLVDDGLVLSIGRRDNHSDLCIPGGKVDSEEEEGTALLRELWEEAGIKAKKFFRVFAAVDSGGYWFITYLVTEWEGKPQPREGMPVGWTLPERMLMEECSYREYNRALFEYVGLIGEAT